MIRFEVDTTLLQKAFSQLNEEVFEAAIMTATQEIARELHEALVKNTPVITGKLKSGWNSEENLSFKVEKVDGGYKVTLINDVEYASAVNYGHPSHNQYNKGGTPYVVKNRIKVPVANPLQNPADATWVWGHFFVEASEAQTEPKCYNIVQKNLRKYFRRWLSGS